MTTLTAVFSDVETATMTVADTSRYPSAGVLTFKGEHIGYSGKTSTTFTGLTRANFTADGGATAQSGGVGDVVRLAVTARHHNVLSEALIAVQTKLGIGVGAPAAGTVLMGTGAGTSGWGQAEPTGVVKQWLVGTIPTGYLELNGQLVSRSTYAALYALWGTTFGAGDGSTTFTLPDLRGRTLFGQDTGNTKFDVIGETGGVEAVTLSAAQSGSPAHNHSSGTLSTDTTGAHTHTVDVTTVNAQSGVNIPSYRNGGTINTGSAGNHSHVISGSVANSSAVAASASHENLPPYLVGRWIVKV